MAILEPDDIDAWSEEQVRDFAKKVVSSLQMAQDEGVFGADSWLGFLEIEVE